MANSSQLPLSTRVLAIKESPTLAITAKAGKYKAEGRPIVGLAAGEPDFDTPQHIKDAAKAILSVFPLDSFIVSQGGTAANRMEVDDNPNELTETHKEFIKVVKEISGPNWSVGSIERQSFYVEAKKSYAIVTTTDARPFGCFILTKGVIKPDGSVWVLEK